MSSRNLEAELKKEGYEYVVGIDAAGLTALAGPIIFAALVMPEDKRINKITAARLIPGQQNNISLYTYFNRVWARMKYLSIVEVSPKEIETYKMKNAIKIGIDKIINHTLNAHELLIDKTAFVIDAFDYQHDNQDVKTVSIKNGDDKEYVLACASVVASVLQQQYMKRIHSEFPIYNWNTNFGYADETHDNAIRIYGSSLFHRS